MQLRRVGFVSCHAIPCTGGQTCSNYLPSTEGAGMAESSQSQSVNSFSPTDTCIREQTLVSFIWGTYPPVCRHASNAASLSASTAHPRINFKTFKFAEIGIVNTQCGAFTRSIILNMIYQVEPLYKSCNSFKLRVSPHFSPQTFWAPNWHLIFLSKWDYI